MPRDGSNIYTQPFPDVVTDTTIESLVYNGYVHDVTIDLNTPRPIIAGGTGANNATDARFNLAAEAAAQIVTNYDSHVWVPGSFRSAAGATGAPTGNAFAGNATIGEALANPPTNQNVVLEARDLNDDVTPGLKYIREKTAGVWSAWTLEPGSQAVRYDIDQELTEPQQKQARQNIYAAPFDAMAYLGMQINGAMGISQENGLATITVPNDVGKYIVDGFLVYKSTGATVTGKQMAAIALPGGFYRAGLTVQATTALSTVNPTDVVNVQHRMEGFRIAKLGWGTAGAQPITISFWINSQNAGHASLAVTNEGFNRSYVADYVIDVINTWEYKTITIPGDTAGVWSRSNGLGIILTWTFTAGTSYQAVGGGWINAAFYATPAQNNLMFATGIVSITGVTVFAGLEGPPQLHSPLLTRPADHELQFCKRHYQKLTDLVVDINTESQSIILPVEMRTAPTITGGGAGFTLNAFNAGVLHFYQTARNYQTIILDARL